MDSYWINFIGIISLVLGIIALGISFLQVSQANIQVKQLKMHSTALSTIAESLSTRYIGKFPEYLEIVTSLIEESRSEVKIIKTNPIQAYFTDFALWKKYCEAIESKLASGVSIKITTLTERQRKVRLRLQFPNTKPEWEIWKGNNIVKINSFLNLRYPSIKVEDVDYNKFVNLLADTQNNLIYENFKLKGIDLIEVDQPMHMQVWVSDEKQAVFTIQTLQAKSISHAFITSDARIVSALYIMCDLFAVQEPISINTHSRIDKIIVTKNLDKSIHFYRDIIGLEMRHISNPVAIFKYDYASIYIYQDSFFSEQFGINSELVQGGGMLSIEINYREYFNSLIDIFTNNSDNFTLLSKNKDQILIVDFNNLVIEFWINSQIR